jgi:hypothetical protein
MSIVSFGREPGYPRTTDTVANKRITVTTEDRFKILTNDPADAGEALLAQVPFPLGTILGSTRLKTRRLTRDAKNRLLHYLDLSYSSEFDEEDETDINKPPDQRRPEWEWDFETEEIAMTKDVQTGDAVVNSAGDVYEVTTPIIIPVLTIERLQADFDPDTIINYVNHTNTATFWGAPAGAALCAGIRDRKDRTEVYNGLSYRRVSYVFKFKLPDIPNVIEGWKLILMNYGPNYWTAPPGVGLRVAASSGGRSINVKLDDDGTKLDDDEDPKFLKFNQFATANFDDLGVNVGQF